MGASEMDRAHEVFLIKAQDFGEYNLSAVSINSIE
jgi:hypothetical protein